MNKSSLFKAEKFAKKIISLAAEEKLTVNEVLKAARLSRNESPRLSEETIFAMFVLLLCFGFMAMLFIFG